MLRTIDVLVAPAISRPGSDIDIERPYDDTVPL
jgi:hypothetical protein